MRQSLATWLIRKIQKFGPHSVSVMGDTFRFSEHVFNPKFYFTSRFMARHLDLRPEDTVLDMGTGSGILAVRAAGTASKVIAVDINAQAVRFALMNARENGVEDRVTVLLGDLFGPFKCVQNFDVILFNPPYLEGVPESPIDFALMDPGRRLLSRFLTEARDHLAPGGYVQILYSSIAGTGALAVLAERAGWRVRLVAEEKIITEKFSIYRLSSAS